MLLSIIWWALFGGLMGIFFGPGWVVLGVAAGFVLGAVVPFSNNTVGNVDHDPDIFDHGRTIGSMLGFEDGISGVYYEAPDDSMSDHFYSPDINPATGLPMIGGIDTAGNLYGFSDSLSGSSFDDDLSISDSFDDGFSSGSDSHDINPATGLVMIGDIDAGGNLYGFGDSLSDSSFDDDLSISDSFDDGFSSGFGSSMFDD